MKDAVAVANPARITFQSIPGGRRAEQLKRLESVAYPELALKEAITNALIHRDYSVPGSDVEVKIFRDRLIIQNPGCLMPGLTTDDLKKDPHPSRRRNPLLADVASKDHWVEQAGTGTTRMLELCVEAGLPEPEFEDRSSGFTVTFRRSRFTPETLLRGRLTERQAETVRYVMESGEINNSQFQELFGVSKRTASNDLTELVETGHLRRIGGTRGVGVKYVLAE